MEMRQTDEELAEMATVEELQAKIDLLEERLSHLEGKVADLDTFQETSERLLRRLEAAWRDEDAAED